MYIYQPPAADQEERSSKRRKTSKNSSQLTDDSLTFLPLLNGKESPELVKLRQTTFQQLWLEQEERCKVGI